MDIQVGESTIGELVPFAIVIFISLVIVIFCIRTFVLTSKIKVEKKKELIELKNKGILNVLTVPHIWTTGIRKYNVQCSML